MHHPLSAKQTLMLILLPMLGTFLCQRLYLHLVRVQHVHVGGHLVHHLFFGVLILIPAAFMLAFGAHRRLPAILSRATLGIGSAMVLDEVIYLVATKASDDDYVSALSLWGGIVLISLAASLLLILFRLHRDKT